MTMNKFYEIGEQGKCPSCYGTNLRKILSNGGGIPSYTCDDCSGFPALCNQNGMGVVYISHDRDMCTVCGEERPNANTHMLLQHIN